MSSRLAMIARLMAVALLLTACSSGVVVKRQHNAQRWLIEVQLDPADAQSRQWMEVTHVVYNHCGIGANYPECRGNQ